MADELDPSMEVDVLAATLLSDLRDNADLLAQLATKFGSAMPESTKVETEGGFFSAKRVKRISLHVGSVHYTIAREKHGPVAHRARFVRGVQIASKELPLTEWAEELVGAIKTLAASNADAQRALTRLVKGD